MTENVHPLTEGVRCPVDGARMWIKTPGYYGCKYGHVMDAGNILAPAELKRQVVIQPREHWPWWRAHPEVPWALAALLLVAQIVEVLT